MVNQFKITKQPLRVLHISSALSWRGGEQQLAYLFDSLDKLGISQLILCAKDSEMETYCKEKSWNYVSQKKVSGFDIFFAKKIKSICKKMEVSLIHTHDAHAHTFAILATTLFKNKTPLIVSRRVDFPIQKSKSSKYKYNHQSVKKIVCVSDKIKEIIAIDIQDKSKLITVHDGISLSRFKNTHVSGKLKQLVGVTNQIVIGNTSALADHKDYFTFIDTIEKVNENRKDCHFVIIGNGPLEDEIKKYASNKGIKNLSFLGFRTDIPEIFGDLDLFMITSKTEGLGTSILDAFACKVPVLATAAGGIPEIVIDNKSGLLCPIKDSHCLSIKLSLIIDDNGLKKKLIHGGNKILLAHSELITAEKTLAVYQSII